MESENAVIACVLWESRGERGPARVQRDNDVAGLISRLLLQPLGREPFTISGNDGTWRNAKKVSQRYDLCKFFLQEFQS